MPFVPDGFEPPTGLVSERFVLEPLGREHNEGDFEAWSSSIAHIRATPGYEGRAWPHEMTLEENRGDLERHADDFAARAGFTYTVLDPASREVIGCVYIYPAEDGRCDAAVRSWVRASRAELDRPLRETVWRWLAEAWPFECVAYAAQKRRKRGCRTNPGFDRGLSSGEARTIHRASSHPEVTGGPELPSL